MAEQTIHLHRRARPVRIAHLVSIRRWASIERALEFNTCTWGGVFNALVPDVTRLPPSMAGDSDRPASGSEVVRGYLRAFDPDIVVAARDDPIKVLDGYTVIRPTDLWRNGEGSPGPNLGISSIEVYRALYESEFKFARRHPYEAILPKTADACVRRLVEMVGGRFPDDPSLRYFVEGYREALGANDLAITADNYFSLFSDCFLPIRAGATQLNVTRARTALEEPTLFLCDSEKPLDLLDYWNLRALHRRVIPIPAHWANSVISSAADFVIRHRRASKGKVLRHFGVTVLKSRSLKKEALEEFSAALRQRVETGFALQMWYPRLWDDRGREWDHIGRPVLSAGTAESEVTIRDSHLTVPALKPEFLTDDVYSSRPKWSVVVRAHVYGAHDVAVVFPRGLQSPGSLFGIFGEESVRIGSEGIVALSRWHSVGHYWRWPTGELTFREWWKSKGIASELSSAGRLSREVIRSLNGLWGVGLLTSAALLQHLNKMSHGLVETASEAGDVRRPRVRGRISLYQELLGLLMREHDNNAVRAQTILGQLVGRGVLRLGLRLTCEVCQQANWYPLDQLADELQCERCLQRFRFPLSSPPQSGWAYRTQGPFAVENYAHGSYATALALRFFAVVERGDVTWTASQNVMLPTGRKFEIDFAFWWRPEFGDQQEPTFVFGEAKSFGGQTECFSAVDSARAKEFGSMFPGAVFVYATLGDAPSIGEVRRLRALAYFGRQRGRHGESRLPVMVLTAQELFASFFPPDSWNAGAEKRRNLAMSTVRHGLRALCDLTQQRYLNMEPYDDWLHERLERARRPSDRRASPIVDPDFQP